MSNLKVATIDSDIITLDLDEKSLYYNDDVIEETEGWTTIDNYHEVIRNIYGIKAKIVDFDELLIGMSINDIATQEELKFTSSNEYGSTDVRINRNIFDIPSDEWIDGISKITLEFDNDGTITHQYNNF